jgi:hypothetical protein
MLKLYVYDPAEGFDKELPATALRPVEYLRERPPWVPDLGECLLLLDPSAGDRLLEINPFGWLHELSAQLDEAACRLDGNQRALIRSCGDWTPTFLALEPDGDVTCLSVLMPLPTDIDWYLPSRRPPADAGAVDQGAVLYDYVEAHRDELRPGPTTSPMVSLIKRRLQNLPLPSAGLPAALREEARAGMELYRTLLPP